MGRDIHEREFDDEVYEDEYYEENLDEEEIDEDSELYKENSDDTKGSWDDEESGDGVERKKVYLSYACEECDYRWDDVVLKTVGNLEDEDDGDDDPVCPMCGSMNVTPI